MTQLTEMQKAFIGSLSEQQRPKAESALMSCELLFADVIPALSGLSVPSSEFAGVSFPGLHLSQADADTENAECHADYAEDIKSGERDSDDAYEGLVMGVRWDSNDDLHFIDLPANETVAKQPALKSMGY